MNTELALWDENMVDMPRRQSLALMLGDHSRFSSLQSQLRLFEPQLQVIVGAGAPVDPTHTLLVDVALLGELPARWRDEVEAEVVVALAERGDFATRMASMEHGVDAFVSLPIDTTALLDRLNHINARAQDEPYRIFALDDDPSVCHIYKLYIDRSRHHIRTFTSPEQMFAALEDEAPELFLLDYHLEHCTGVDVARVLRQDHAFVGVPIVFVSGNDDAEVHFGAMASGGDQFLQKPIDRLHFLQMIESTIDRFRELRALMSHDSLTQLHNHTSFKQQLALQVVSAFRQQTPLSLVMMDIDHFKDVNDTHGHPVGDRVLRVLAQLLRGRLRRSDVIGRYGGDEFAVLMPGTSMHDAYKVMDEIRHHFGALTHRADNGSFFHATISCGVADCARFSSESALTLAADKALYVAKKQGRDRVCLAEEPAE